MCVAVVVVVVVVVVVLKTGGNGDKKAVSWLSTVLCDEKQASFSWLLSTVLPTFLGDVLQVGV